MTERQHDSIPDVGNDVHVIPSEMMSMLKLIYTEQVRLLRQQVALHEKIDRCIAELNRTHVISDEAAARILNRLI